MRLTQSKLTLTITLILFFTCFSLSYSYSQTKDSLLRVYNNETIRTFGKFYIKGSEQLKFGDLKSQFTSGLTKDLYKKSKGNLVLSRIFTFTSVAALVTSAIIKKNNNGGAAVLSIAGIGLNLGSLHFRKQSREIIETAIWQRNKEILFGIQ